MELTSEQVTVFKYEDLEKLVKQAYGHDISILDSYIPDERMGHYTYHEWTVNGSSELDLMGDDIIVQKWIESGDLDDIDMTDVVLEDGSPYWRSDASVGLEHILHRLYLDKIIPAGKYLMKVDW
jgi:hypothetical protein